MILVTGGAGFIGAHLCRRLASDGYHVISLDDYSTGSEDNHIPGVEYRRGHTISIEILVPEKPNVIFHFGEHSRVEASFNDEEASAPAALHAARRNSSVSARQARASARCTRRTASSPSRSARVRATRRMR